MNLQYEAWTEIGQTVGNLRLTMEKLVIVNTFSQITQFAACFQFVKF